MATQRVAIEDIQLGHAAVADIRDDEGRVLLAAGIQLCSDFVDGLRRRGITHVNVTETNDSKNSGNKKGGSAAQDPEELRFSKRRVDRRREPYSTERTQQFRQQMRGARELLECVGNDLTGLKSEKIAELAAIPEAFAGMILDDCDQALAASSSKEILGNVVSRSTQMSLLSMAIAIEMGQTNENVLLIGTAGLLHDLGLFALPEHLWERKKTLSYEDRELYQTHPQQTCDILAEQPIVSETVKLLIMQVHELPDGSGFPRGVLKHRHHPLTRILNAVEIYLSLVSPGAGRPPIAAHDAIAAMLFQCRTGVVDVEVMRALINQLCLFPIGSRVMLSDGSVGTVMRRDETNYDEPVVWVDGMKEGEFLNLHESENTIVAPCFDNATEMRLSKDMCASLELGSLLDLVS